MHKTIFKLLLTLCLIQCGFAQSEETRFSLEWPVLLYQDDFENDLSNWVIEQVPGGSVKLSHGKLEIEDAGGCTVWFKEKLSGRIMIEYEATMIDSGGTYDRVSDLNCFWMAKDPDNPGNIFADTSRGGIFANYHALRLYYVGYGANYNTTTRFRRYPGDGSRPNLPEHDLTDNKFMHIPNKTIFIRIISDGQRIEYFRDGEHVFSFRDKEPFTEGWFGFRTVKNHMVLDNFKVYQIF